MEMCVCVVVIMGGQAREVELTAFVTVRGCKFWPTTAVDQPPPRSHALSTHTHTQR